MIVTGDIAPRRDTDQELYVAVLSNSLHLAAGTGRVIACPFIPGEIPGGAMSLVVTVTEPQGVVLPELIQWIPLVGLDEPIGKIGAAALQETTAIVSALIS